MEENWMPKQNVVQKKKIQDHLAEWKTANGCIDIFSTKCKDHRGPLRSVEELDRLAKSYSDKYIYIYIYIYIYTYISILFFVLQNIHASQDSRERVRLSLYLLSTTCTSFRDT